MSPEFKKKVHGTLLALGMIFVVDNVKFFFLDEASRGYLEILKSGTFFWGTMSYLAVVIAFFKHQKDA